LRAQKPGKVYRLAIFTAGSRKPFRNFAGALRDFGWIEGKNVKNGLPGIFGRKEALAASLAREGKNT
jgi:hypothetical protein